MCVCAYLSDCEVCALARRHTLYTIDDFIDGNCYTNKTGKPYCMRFFYFGWCIVGVQLVCVMIVTILYIKNLWHSILIPPLFQDRLLTPIWTILVGESMVYSVSAR